MNLVDLLKKKGFEIQAGSEMENGERYLLLGQGTRNVILRCTRPKVKVLDDRQTGRYHLEVNYKIKTNDWKLHREGSTKEILKAWKPLEGI